jgi:hypothetical protein
MTMIWHIQAVPGILLAGLALSGCNSTEPADTKLKPQAATMTVFADLSGSTVFMGSPSYTSGAVAHIGEDIQKQPLGTRFRVLSLGSLTADNAVDVLSVSSDYQNRIPAVRKQVTGALGDLFERNRLTGGQGGTNITYALTNAHPSCTPGSRVVILSDGVEESASYSVSRALSAGQPVNLPAPAGPILKACSVAFVGLGMMSTTGGATQSLPDAQLQALTAGWRAWFAAAGVQPDDVTFTTIL